MLTFTRDYAIIITERERNPNKKKEIKKMTYNEMIKKAHEMEAEAVKNGKHAKGWAFDILMDEALEALAKEQVEGWKPLDFFATSVATPQTSAN